MENKKYNQVKSTYGFISASPLPTEAELTEHYSSKYYDAPQTATYQTGYDDAEIAQKKLRASLAIHALQQACSGDVKGKKLFEVGCGEGFILQAGQDAGMQIAGVDFTDAGIMRMNPQLKPFVTDENAYTHLDRLIAEGTKFDFCVIQNVLEHVIDPEGLLKNLKRIINPGGLILVNVPNDFSDLQKLAIEKGFINREFWFGPVEHLHYFNTDNLPKFVTAMGFDVVDAYGDFPIDFFLLNEHANYVMDKSKGKASHRARIMLDLLMAEKGMANYHKFCQAMSGVGVGRNICVIARMR